MSRPGPAGLAAGHGLADGRDLARELGQRRVDDVDLELAVEEHAVGAVLIGQVVAPFVEADGGVVAAGAPRPAVGRDPGLLQPGVPVPDIL